jgi:hypothetical protein
MNNTYIKFDACEPAFKPGDIVLFDDFAQRFAMQGVGWSSASPYDQQKWTLTLSTEAQNWCTDRKCLGLIVSGPWCLGARSRGPNAIDRGLPYISRFQVLHGMFGLIFLNIYHRSRPRATSPAPCSPIEHPLPGLRKL